MLHDDRTQSRSLLPPYLLHLQPHRDDRGGGRARRRRRGGRFLRVGIPRPARTSAHRKNQDHPTVADYRLSAAGLSHRHRRGPARANDRGAADHGQGCGRARLAGGTGARRVHHRAVQPVSTACASIPIRSDASPVISQPVDQAAARPQRRRCLRRRHHRRRHGRPRPPTAARGAQRPRRIARPYGRGDRAGAGAARRFLDPFQVAAANRPRS